MRRRAFDRALLVGGLLFGLQVLALVEQVRLGFRPFGHEPVRVPLSWDMFATRIERCRVAWSPPLAGPRGPWARLEQLSPRLEWDVVYDSRDAYRAKALQECRYAEAPTRISLDCFSPDGRETRDELDCPAHE